MDAKPVVPRWKRLYELTYRQKRPKQKDGDEWSPPGPLFDAILFGLLVVLAIGYFA